MMEQEHLIELKNVSKEFDGTTVLSDIDLYIRKKEFLTLMREIVYIGYLFLIGAEQSVVTILRALLCAAYSAAMILPCSLITGKVMSIHPFKRKKDEDLTEDMDVKKTKR